VALDQKDVRRRPTLPQPLGCSTIGAERLNFRVRYGTGCFPFAMAAVTLSTSYPLVWTPSTPTRVLGVGLLVGICLVDAGNTLRRVLFHSHAVHDRPRMGGVVWCGWGKPSAY
jgi:hypothetical protein